MKQKLFAMFLIGTVSVMLLACGWNPNIEAVQLTEPWIGMNLPVQENAIVFRSDPKEFRAVHKEDKGAVLKKYSDVLRSQGWKATDFKEDSYDMTVTMERSGESLTLRVYDFENTGVVIELP